MGTDWSGSSSDPQADHTTSTETVSATPCLPDAPGTDRDQRSRGDASLAAADDEGGDDAAPETMVPMAPWATRPSGKRSKMDLPRPVSTPRSTWATDRDRANCPSLTDGRIESDRSQPRAEALMADAAGEASGSSSRKQGFPECPWTK